MGNKASTKPVSTKPVKYDEDIIQQILKLNIASNRSEITNAMDNVTNPHDINDVVDYLNKQHTSNLNIDNGAILGAQNNDDNGAISGSQNNKKLTTDDIKTAGPFKVSSNWMGHVSDNVLLSDINIPGTHDTCCVIKGIKQLNPANISTSGNVNFLAQHICTQALSVGQQLESGIRFLDIRCFQKKDKFKIYHGKFDLNISFDEVLNDCREFLDKHPTECILMSIKKEDDGKPETFKEILSVYANGPYPWWKGNVNNIPTLLDVRGTIIPFCRCPNTNFGIDLNDKWVDDKTFKIDKKNTGGIFTIQDVYRKGNTDDKKGFIQPLLLGNLVPQQYYINFTSMSNLITIGDPYYAAKQIIPFLWDKLSHLNNGTKVGIIVMDYPEIKDGLIGKIASLNKGVTAFKNIYHPDHPEHFLPVVPVIEKVLHSVSGIIDTLSDIDDTKKRSAFTKNTIAQLEKTNPNYCYVVARDFIDDNPNTKKTVDSEYTNVNYELPGKLNLGTFGYHIISFDKTKKCKFDFKSTGKDAGDINWYHSSDWTVISDGYGVVYNWPK